MVLPRDSRRSWSAPVRWVEVRTVARSALRGPRHARRYRWWQCLLHLGDRHRGHEPDERQEQQEEEPEASDGERAVDDGGDEDAPGERIETVAERGHDDVEPLQPHPDQDGRGDPEQRAGVTPGPAPEQK